MGFGFSGRRGGFVQSGRSEPVHKDESKRACARYNADNHCPEFELREQGRRRLKEHTCFQENDVSRYAYDGRAEPRGNARDYRDTSRFVRHASLLMERASEVYRHFRCVTRHHTPFFMTKNPGHPSPIPRFWIIIGSGGLVSGHLTL